MLNHDDIVALSEAVTQFRRLQAKDLVMEEWPHEEAKIALLIQMVDGFRQTEQSRLGTREEWEEP